MRFTYNERKAAQAAAYLIQLHHGTLNYTVAIKLLYLADRLSLVEKGRPITGDSMVSMPKGPVLSITLNLIRCPDVHGGDADAGPWFDYVKKSGAWDIQLAKTNPELDELSAYELRVLDRVNQQFGAMTFGQLIDWTHRSLPEWHDPKGSSRWIEPEEVLRAENVPEAQIESFQALAEEVWLLCNPDQIRN